jgi:hypothetical protein
MRKAFILSDFLIISITLSAIAGMLLSTSLMSYQNSKTEFIAQKKTYFSAMLKNAEEKCIETADPEKRRYVYEYEKVISDKYRIYIYGTCEQKEDSNNIYKLNYTECIYSYGEGAFANGALSENNCKQGIRYVSI